MPWIANVSEAYAVSNTKTKGVACISITSPTKTANLPNGYEEVYRVQFDDYDGLTSGYPEHAELFTEYKAKCIVAFARKHVNIGNDILVHCAAGVSRSGAVVEALLEAFPQYEDAGWIRHPNGLVKSLMKRALGLVPIGAEREADGPSEKAG